MAVGFGRSVGGVLFIDHSVPGDARLALPPGG
jgi:hypothetical protein